MNTKPITEKRVRFGAYLDPKAYHCIKILKEKHGYRSDGAVVDAAIRLLVEATKGGEQ